MGGISVIADGRVYDGAGPVDAYASASTTMEEAEPKLIGVLFDAFFAHTRDSARLHQLPNFRFRKVQKSGQQGGVDEETICIDCDVRPLSLLW